MRRHVQHGPAAIRRAATASIIKHVLFSEAAPQRKGVIDEQFFAGGDVARGLYEDTAAFEYGLTVRVAGMVDEARNIAVDSGIDHKTGARMKQLRIALKPVMLLSPFLHAPLVFNDPIPLFEGSHCEDPETVDGGGATNDAFFRPAIG